MTDRDVREALRAAARDVREDLRAALKEAQDADDFVNGMTESEIIARVREVVRLLDERADLLRRPGDPSLAAYFEGHAAGEMAGCQQAADALRRALGDDE